jgi:GNAT superfamily N-acetyltransferase
MYWQDKTMNIVKCGTNDIPTLAMLNKQLIEDEQHENLMSIDELAKRMEEFINGEYEALFFEDQGHIIGYALVKKACYPMYLRHFFICRDERRKGLGTSFFRDLLKYLKTETIDIEVLSWNNNGIHFWESVGFKPRSIYMRYTEGI